MRRGNVVRRIAFHDLIRTSVMPAPRTGRLPADEMRARMRALGQRAATYPEQPIDYGKVRY